MIRLGTTPVAYYVPGVSLVILLIQKQINRTPCTPLIEILLEFVKESLVAIGKLLNAAPREIRKKQRHHPQLPSIPCDYLFFNHRK